MILKWISPLLGKEGGSVVQTGIVLHSGADTACFMKRGVDFSNPYLVRQSFCPAY